MLNEIQQLHSSQRHSFSSSPRSSVRVLPSTLEPSNQNFFFKPEISKHLKFSQEKRSSGNEDLEEYVYFDENKKFLIGSGSGMRSQERQKSADKTVLGEMPLYQNKFEKSERSISTNNSASKRLRMSRIRMNPYQHAKESQRDKRSLKLSSGGVSSHHIKESNKSSNKTSSFN